MSTLPAGVYLIGCDGAQTNDGEPSVTEIGFKAWNLMRMAQLSMPVPAAFVLGTRHCVDPGVRMSAQKLWGGALSILERNTGLVFGDPRHPLLVSVRSGAPVSMPGMMETLLNIGLCDATVGGLLRQTGNPRLVWDAYRRLVSMYGEVVAGIDADVFETASLSILGSRSESELDFADLRALTRRFLDVYARASGHPFPQNPKQQLEGAIDAVFASWKSPRAREYRRVNSIDDTVGTAVTVQRMVFGNAGGQSGAGVGFTRNPATGEPALWVDFLFNAQGEDVVSGRRNAYGHEELERVLPETWSQLQRLAQALEVAFADMQDFEFTVQEGHLFMLQTRTGKRTARAAARIAVDMLDQGLIGTDLAKSRTIGLDREALAQASVVAADGALLVPLAHATSAGNGVAIGEIALDEVRALARHSAGVSVVLVRRDAETSDIAALGFVSGVLTQRGARTAHAAVVARQLGKVCLVGCSALQIDEATRHITIAENSLREGDIITLDGNVGTIYAGAAQLRFDYPEVLLSRLRTLHAPDAL